MQPVMNKTPYPDPSKNTAKKEEAIEALERLDRLLKGENPLGSDKKTQKLPDTALIYLKKMIPNPVWMIH